MVMAILMISSQILNLLSCKALASRRKPKMIHFAGENKPLGCSHVDFFDNFMSYIDGTPWQQEVVNRLYAAVNVIANNTGSATKYYSKQKVKRKLMPYLNRYAPVGSKRRQHIAKRIIKFIG